MAQPDHTDELKHFRDWLKEARLRNKFRQSIDGKEEERPGFIPKSEVKKYLNRYQIRRLLDVLFPEQSPVTAAEVEEHRLPEFCVLLCISQGRFIEQLVRLPPDANLRSAFTEDVWQRYSAAQWEFIVEDLRKNRKVEFVREHSLPFIRKDLIARGSSSNLWQVVVHRDYDKLGPISQDPEQPHNHYALKEYKTRRKESHYKNETNNFRRLCSKGCPPGLIEYLGAFQHGDDFNMLLKLADGGSLQDLLNDQQPPEDGLEIYQIWSKVAELLHALVRIHQLEGSADEDGNSPKFLGSHQDIRPENIVLFRNMDEDGEFASASAQHEFKLADLGLAKLVKDTGKSIDTTMLESRGGRNYGSPEAYRADSFDADSPVYVNSKTDVFSLGCVFLVVAVWIVYNPAGVNGFHEQRKDENARNSNRADYRFHNGEHNEPDLLDTVKQRMENLPQHIRRNDYTTGKMLELIEKMIDPEVETRYTSAQARKAADKLLNKAQTELEDQKAAKSARMLKKAKTTPFGKQPSIDARGKQTMRRNPDSSASAPTQERQFSADRFFPSSPNHTVSEATHQLSAFGIHNEAPVASGSRTLELSEAHLTQDGHEQNIDIYTEPPNIDQRESEIPQRSRERSITSRPNTSEQEPPAAFSNPRPRGATYSSNANVAVQTMVPPSSNLESASNQPHQPVKESSPPPPTSPVEKKPRRQTKPWKVSEALEWKKKRQSFAGHLMRFSSKSKPPSWDYAMTWLKRRDHIFLIDNATTMQTYWRHVIETFEALAYVVKSCDPDGVELFFTTGNNKFQHTETTALIDEVKKFKPSTGSNLTTNIRKALGPILSKKHQAIENQKLVRPTSIYVLTDGIWAGGQDARSSIMETIDLMKRHDRTREDLCIQLISFGENADGLARMRSLDDMNQQKDVKMDIVDTEPFSGDVWKMLIGPISEYMDHTQDQD